QPERLGLGRRSADHLRVRGLTHLLFFPDHGVRFAGRALLARYEIRAGRLGSVPARTEFATASAELAVSGRTTKASGRKRRYAISISVRSRDPSAVTRPRDSRSAPARR